MRVLVTVLVLTGCSTAPISVSAPVPPGVDAFACAVSELNLLGYTVEDANREAGFARGVKQTSVLFTDYDNVLTVSVFRGQGAGTTMRATAARVEKDRFTRSSRPLAPSGDGQDDANAVLAKCAPAAT